VPPADGEVRCLLGEQAVPSDEGGELRAAVCPQFISTFRTYVLTVSTVMFIAHDICLVLCPPVIRARISVSRGDISYSRSAPRAGSAGLRNC
jgi:hypothetical protein